MEHIIRDWINVALRWSHVFAGIMWVGQTFLFTWLDHTLNKEGQVWMVHSGGFYIVDKQKRPELLPKTLHWFKYEAAFTWLSGLLLFALVYWTGGLMAGGDVELTTLQASLLSAGLIVAGWFVYDLLWISPLARKSETAGVIVSYVLLVGAIYAITRVFPSRAAYMQIGAMLGTNMAWNVWARILPAQRQLIGAVQQGLEPDMRLADIAKQRSKHNTFVVLPVVFIMLSNHFPIATYGYDWRVLAVVVLVGWGVAKLIRDH